MVSGKGKMTPAACLGRGPITDVQKRGQVMEITTFGDIFLK